MYRVLVVDDDSQIVEMLKRLLTAVDITVDGVLDSPEALELLKIICPYHYNALISDINLPNLDGVRLARLFHVSQRISIIIISASENSNINPSFWFFQKPLGAKELYDLKSLIELLKDKEEMSPIKNSCTVPKCTLPGV